jgi:hypothetical protein
MREGSVCHEGSRRRQLDEKWGSQFGLSVPRGRGHGFRRLNRRWGQYGSLFWARLEL